LHKKNPWHKFFGNLPYQQALYSHFWDEHTKGHHKDIATDIDPVSHPRGTSFYFAMVRAIYGTHITTWNRETERIRKSIPKISVLQIIMLYRRTHYFILHCIQLSTCYVLFGFSSVRFMLIYGILGIFWLEVVNYIEHYGLRRKIVGY